MYGLIRAFKSENSLMRATKLMDEGWMVGEEWVLRFTLSWIFLQFSKPVGSLAYLSCPLHRHFQHLLGCFEDDMIATQHQHLLPRLQDLFRIAAV